MKEKVEIPSIEFSNEQRENLLVGALEGGSNYWYWLGGASEKEIDKHTSCLMGERVPLAMRMFEALKKGAVIPIFDLENAKEKLGEISMASIVEGEHLLFTKHFYNYSNIKLENDDAGDADVWFQLAVMKEVVYG